MQDAGERGHHEAAAEDAHRGAAHLLSLGGTAPGDQQNPCGGQCHRHDQASPAHAHTRGAPEGRPDEPAEAAVDAQSAQQRRNKGHESPDLRPVRPVERGDGGGSFRRRATGRTAAARRRLGGARGRRAACGRGRLRPSPRRTLPSSPTLAPHHHTSPAGSEPPPTPKGGGRGAASRRLAPAPKERTAPRPPTGHPPTPEGGGAGGRPAERFRQTLPTTATAAPDRTPINRGRGPGGRFATPCARAEGANGTPAPDRTPTNPRGRGRRGPAGGAISPDAPDDGHRRPRPGHPPTPEGGGAGGRPAERFRQTLPTTATAAPDRTATDPEGRRHRVRTRTARRLGSRGWGARSRR